MPRGLSLEVAADICPYYFAIKGVLGIAQSGWLVCAIQIRANYYAYANTLPSTDSPNRDQIN